MKNVLIVLVFGLFSCKSGQEIPEMVTQNEVIQKEMIISYSKGACLGNCPVYDLRIFEDGSAEYKGIKNVKKRGAVNTKLSKEEFMAFSKLLKNLEPPKKLQKIRDRPVTSLHCNGRKYSYYANRIDGQLKDLNTKLEALVAKINEAPSTY